MEPDITVFEITGRLNLGNLLMTVENSMKRLPMRKFSVPSAPSSY